MNKQIEEMTKVLNQCCNVYDEQGNHIRNKCDECECWSDDNHCCCSYNSKEATALYNAGYRKSTDVARGIFEEIEDALDNLDYYGYTEEGFDACVTFEDVQRLLERLKKKYESEGADDV